MKLNLNDIKPNIPPRHFKTNKCCATCKRISPIPISIGPGFVNDYKTCLIHKHEMSDLLTLISICKDYVDKN